MCTGCREGSGPQSLQRQQLSRHTAYLRDLFSVRIIRSADSFSGETPFTDNIAQEARNAPQRVFWGSQPSPSALSLRREPQPNP